MNANLALMDGWDSWFDSPKMLRGNECLLCVSVDVHRALCDPSAEQQCDTTQETPPLRLTQELRDSALEQMVGRQAEKAGEGFMHSQ